MSNPLASLIPTLRLVSLGGVLIVGSLALTGCAHDRHTGAVIGGIVGATIGYVIANESDSHHHHHHHHRGQGHYQKHPPPHRDGHRSRATRDPYCD